MATALASNTECRLLDALRPQEKAVWISALEEMPHDIYHLPDFAKADANVAGGEPVAFLFREHDRTLLVPLVLRTLPEPIASHRLLYSYRDATGPYGYPCPIMSLRRSDSMQERADFVHRGMRSMAVELRSRGVVSAFMRLHPLLTNRGLYEDFETTRECGKIVSHGESVYCDLTQSTEEMWQQTRRRDRSYINKLTREGYRLSLDSSWSQLDQFIDMYYATMERVAASDFYFFPRSYFEELRSSLGAYTHLAFVVAPDGELACGAVLTTCGGLMQYHLAGTSNRFLNGHPNKLLIHQLRLWAKQQGMRAFHLGGGVGASSDSLLHFKSGFSKRRSPFASYRLIADNDAYAKLLSFWSTAANKKHSDITQFFPAYRRADSQVLGGVRRHLRVIRSDGSVFDPNPKTNASTHATSSKRRAG